MAARAARDRARAGDSSGVEIEDEAAVWRELDFSKASRSDPSQL
jgi:hypothetical protein